MDEQLVTRLRFALYRYGGHVPPCPGRPCECGFLAEWRAAQLPETFLDVAKIALLPELPPIIQVSAPRDQEKT
jgi:hypothetical protein